MYLPQIIEPWIPSLCEIFVVSPIGFLCGLTALYFSGKLKRDLGWRTGYTRKCFHFLIFFTAAAVQFFFGLSSLVVFGSSVSLVIFYAILRGNGNLLYEALAREKDAPYRTYFILIPYLATLFGGVIGNLVYGNLAITGYLVTGIADAVAEPVGTKYGKMKYPVSRKGNVVAYRTFEGSLSVFIASLLALLFGSVLTQGYINTNWMAIFTIAIIATIVEAVSPHGWDNFYLQVIPTGLFWFFLTF